MIITNQITIKDSCVRKIREIIVKAMPTDNQLWLLVFLPALAMASPPKRSDRRTPPPHSSRTEFPDWSIYDTVCDGLPTHIHIMGDCLQTGCLQNILRAWVRPGPVGFPLRPQTGHLPRGTNVKTTIAKEVVLAYPDFTKSFDIF